MRLVPMDSGMIYSHPMESRMAAYALEGGRWMDPARGTSGEGTVWIHGGRMHFTAPPAGTPVQRLNAAGQWIVPGLLDLHVHLREPGNEAAETIRSGTRAAAAGGFTAIVCMPNTRPPLDTPESVAQQLSLAAAAGFCRLLPSACLTVGRSGKTVAPLDALVRAGAAAFTDDGCTVMDDPVMREAMQRARALNRAVMDHAQDTNAEARGCMHEGEASARFGLPGIPSSAEADVIERDIRLSRETGCALHIQHITSREGVEAVRRARAEGLPVTAEVTPHHLALCDTDMPGPDPNWKMNPPLRGARDRDALRQAVLDGVVTCLATDHAPHTAESKNQGMRHAPFGVVGLETAVGVTWTELVQPGRMGMLDWLRLWTTGPASVLGLPAPAIADGAVADITVLDLESEWVVDPSKFLSLSRNTPFAGRTLRGRAVATFLQGTCVFSALAPD